MVGKMTEKPTETLLFSGAIDGINTKIIDFCELDLYSRLYSVSA